MSGEPRQSTAPVVADHPLLAQGIALHRDGHLDAAAKVYVDVLSSAPNNFEATHLLGVIALQQGRLEEAQRLIKEALDANPLDVVAMGNLGTSYLRAGQPELASRWFDAALTLQPDSVTALLNAGTALHNAGRHLDAIPMLRKAYAIDASSFAVCNLLGACLIKYGETHEAAILFEAATQANPNSAEGWANRSVALNALGQHTEARECADKAVSLGPESWTALGALGGALVYEGRIAEAIKSYRQAATMPGASASLLYEFACALLASGLNEEAIEQLGRAVDLDQGNLTIRWAVALAQVKPICNSAPEVTESRQRLGRALDEVAAWYRATDTVQEPFTVVGTIQPFYLAYQPFNNRELLSSYGSLCADWMATMPMAASYARACAEGMSQSHTATRKLRIGFVSAHIRDHSVWNAITSGWIYNIDKTKFDIYLFQLKSVSDPETDRARRAVAHFDDQPTNLAAWAGAITEQKLDVLIYPEIGMDALTTQLASLRLAPVQAATWGHPETTGLPTVDLYISGDALEPTDASDNYREKLVRLPNLGVHVEPLTPATLKPGLRSLNLPTNEPLLLCPGAPFKYSALDDDIWVQIARHLKKRIFRRSSGGRLVFFRSRIETMDRMLEDRLRAAFAAAGVDFDAHVSIISNLDRARFFGLMRKSALMLDSLGFSGFNTAIQSIECDLPVLAYEGEFMRGRLASAIMRRLDLPELVATTREEFVHKAVALAGNPRERRRLQAKIIERRKVLFHDMEPVRSLERCLTDAVAQSYT